MASIFDNVVCNEAIEMAKTGIVAQMEKGKFKRKDLCIVVVNPSIVPGSISRTEFVRRGILHEHVIGDKDKWKTDYSWFAKYKAYLTWRHRMSSRMIQTCFPHLLEDGDILYGGSIIFNEIVVAASALDEHDDELVSLWVAGGIYRECIAKRRTLDPNTNAFLA